MVVWSHSQSEKLGRTRYVKQIGQILLLGRLRCRVQLRSVVLSCSATLMASTASSTLKEVSVKPGDW